MPKAIQLDSILTFAESCYVAVAINCCKRYCDTFVLLLCNFVSLCATDDIADVT